MKSEVDWDINRLARRIEKKVQYSESTWGSRPACSLVGPHGHAREEEGGAKEGSIQE